MANRFEFNRVVVEYDQVYQGFNSSMPLGDGKVTRTRKDDGKYESHEPFSYRALRHALYDDGFEMTKRLYPNGKNSVTRAVREIYRRSLMGTIVVPVQEQGVRTYGA